MKKSREQEFRPKWVTDLQRFCATYLVWKDDECLWQWGGGGGSDANTKLNLISKLAREEFTGLIYIWSQFMLISLFLTFFTYIILDKLPLCPL